MSLFVSLLFNTPIPLPKGRVICHRMENSIPSSDRPYQGGAKDNAERGAVVRKRNVEKVFSAVANGHKVCCRIEEAAGLSHTTTINALHYLMANNQIKRVKVSLSYEYSLSH